MENLNIGLFGFGCVGSGLYDVLHRTKGIRAEIARICIKNADKERDIDASHFTTDRHELLNDDNINVIVELIDDADAAFEIVTEALKRGKAVVTANKKMLAEHFEELYALQQEAGVPFLYEASVCGSIPVLRNLEEYYDNDLLSGVQGVFNGTTNYILTKAQSEGSAYDVVLKKAQELGFAESDPTLDVEGFDAKYKLCIALVHAFGLIVKPEDVFTYGISSLSLHEVRFARERGRCLRLLAVGQKEDDKVHAFVIPVFVQPESPFFNINNEDNAVTVGAAFSDRQLFVGKGAGSHPTASAVLSDISALTHGYRYEYKVAQRKLGFVHTQETELTVYLRYPDEETLAQFNFEEVLEKYQSADLRYVIAKVKLQELQDKREALSSPELFLAALATQA